MLILWGWAALIAFSSMFLLFFRFVDVLIGFVVLAVLLTIATLYPYFKRMAPVLTAMTAYCRKAMHPSTSRSPDGHNRQLRSSCKSPQFLFPLCLPACCFPCASPA